MCARNFPYTIVDGPNWVRRTLKSRKNQPQWQIAKVISPYFLTNLTIRRRSSNLSGGATWRTSKLWHLGRPFRALQGAGPKHSLEHSARWTHAARRPLKHDSEPLVHHEWQRPNRNWREVAGVSRLPDVRRGRLPRVRSPSFLGAPRGVARRDAASWDPRAPRRPPKCHHSSKNETRLGPYFDWCLRDRD